MPPRRRSRHSFTYGLQREGDFVLTTPSPFRYVERADTRVVSVNAGETIFSIAGREYQQLSKRASGLWWIIADFQPSPIHDPTLELAPGTTLFIPSHRLIVEEIFSESRREE